jgi:hypothetical protein
VLKGQIWATRVNLYLALGGDWIDQEKTVRGTPHGEDGRRITDDRKQNTGPGTKATG